MKILKFKWNSIYRSIIPRKLICSYLNILNHRQLPGFVYPISHAMSKQLEAVNLISGEERTDQSIVISRPIANE
jgi:hypothetical protein